MGVWSNNDLKSPRTSLRSRVVMEKDFAVICSHKADDRRHSAMPNNGQSLGEL